MKFAAVATLLSLASAASAAAIPTRQGPLSFMVASENNDFHGKWLSPATTGKSSGKATATLSESRYRRFFITVDSKLEYEVKPGVYRTARLNDLLMVYPLLATVTFKDPASSSSESDDIIRTETTFKVNEMGAIDVRNGKKWYACKETDGSITAKVLVKGPEAEDKKCSEITLHAVDGIAK